MFNPEKFDRENYDQLASKANQDQDTYDKIWNEIVGKEGRSLRDPRGIELRRYGKQLTQTRDQLVKMRDRAHGEALKLAEQYDKLLEQAIKANDDVRNFQEEKLGMHQGSNQDTGSAEESEK